MGLGDTVDLRGNPLPLWALCVEVAELEERGVTVYTTEWCMRGSGVLGTPYLIIVCGVLSV